MTERNNELMNNDFENPFRDFFNTGLPDFTRAFDNMSMGNVDGRANVANNAKDYAVAIQLPGFNKKQIHLDYRNNYLAVAAKHTVNKSAKNNKGNVVRKEFSNSNVARQFYLPDVDFDKISASYDGGILRVTLPKKNPRTNKDTHSINIK